MKFGYMLTCAFCFVFILSCRNPCKNADNPIDSNVVSWVPHPNVLHQTFSNDSLGTDTFVFDTFINDRISGYDENDCYCYTDIVKSSCLITEGSYLNSIANLRTRINFSGRGSEYLVQCTNMAASYDASDGSCSGYGKYYDTYTLGGTVYNEVFQADQYVIWDQGPINSIFVSRQSGFIGYKDKNGMVWVVSN